MPAATYTFPSVSEVKKETAQVNATVRDYVKLPENMADKPELVRKFHDESFTRFQQFMGQSSRTELEENLRSADAMLRLAKRVGRTVKGSTQQQDTLSNLSSSQFYKSIKTVWAGQCSILFGTQDDVPARYDPPVDGEYVQHDEAKRVAEADTMALRYTWYKDKWEEKIKDLLWFIAKNSISVFDVDWEFKTDTVVERLPGYYTKDKKAVAAAIDEAPKDFKMFDYTGREITKTVDKKGKPLSFVFVERVKVVKNCPTITRYDMKDVYFDLDIPDIQNQSCVVIRMQKPLADLMAGQRDGLFKNVEKLNDAQLFTSEADQGSPTAQDRDDNADYSRDNSTNGLIDVYRVLMIAPVDDEGKKWDEDMMPRFYEGYFAGRFGTMSSDGETVKGKDGADVPKKTGCVCLCLRRLPYHDNKLKLHSAYTHRDERGAVRMGYQTLLECNFEQQTTRLNQWLDNNELAVRAPMVGEKGNVLTRSLTFDSANKVIWVKPGTGATALTKMQIPDMTQRLIPEMNMLSQDADDIADTGEAMRGEYAGSRTTSTEVMSAKQQAMTPAIENAKYVASQIFVPILEDCASLWRQFGDPKTTIKVTNGDKLLGTFSPGDLYGESVVRIVSVAQFEKDLVARQVINNALSSGAYDKSAEFIDREEFWRVYYRVMGFPDVHKIVKGQRRYVEAENQAWSDIQAIQQDPVAAASDENLLPKPGEMHDVHIRILTQFSEKMGAMSKLYPQDEWLANVLATIGLYITMHEQFKAAAATEMGGGQQGMPQGPQQGGAQDMAGAIGGGTTGQPGEAAGDMMTGLAGQMA